MFNASQRQLLKILGIQPLQLRAQFQFSSKSASEDLDSRSSIQLLCPDVNHGLVQDVLAFCQQQPVAAEKALLLGTLHWSIQPELTACQLSEHQLLTPELATLAATALKRQLWQCLSRYFDAAD
ncbi:hypothetical protein Q3O59_11745 [Alkalimonas delamerensis]|uniref:DNA polymerase III subunit psi n=1 Tax=Alkalimonas delamerensis TaxID=265981 RepID=A0ABT9GRU7_9GAMM|nr:hypothetical protein [Alkalimonas delamerensis]MDP4529694.1 hypothetical protein [Alkalimonas delamerensis]